MKRLSFLTGLVILLLLVAAGIVTADSQNTTITANVTPEAIATTPPDMTGGSISFETFPAGATIWVDNIEIGASPLTYFFETTGTHYIVIQKKGYDDYTDKVTVSDGRRVFYSAVLTMVTRTPVTQETPVLPVTAVTTTTPIPKSTVTLPTPWPTSPRSPVDPAVAIGAAALALGIGAIRRR